VTRAGAYARLFDGVHQGVFIGTLSVAGGVTTAVNPHLKRMFGYAAEARDTDVQPFAPERFLDPDARQGFLERLRAQSHITDHLLRLQGASRDAMWVEVTAVARAAKNRALYVEALVRDVSERRRIEDQSRDLYQQLLQAERMAALGQTMSGVAHELNNPLATILGWAERLAERPLDDAARKGVSVILSEAERAARIVRNLLTFARKRQSTRAMVDINHIVTETLALRVYEQRVTNITVATVLDTDLPPAFADAHQIQQVLLNLIINAEHAMLGAHGGGALQVRTQHDRSRDAIVIEVRDNGPGVPSTIRSRIFDPFFTTKEAGKGTGLGLTVAHAIVQEHGGRLQLECPAEGGALFRVELPVTGIPVSLKKSPIPSSADVARGAAVLIVENERALAAAVAEGLDEAGLQVTHADDGEQALALMERNRYDIVVCDLKMPRVDGVAFYKAVQSRTAIALTPVIFMTGDVADTDAARFFEETGCRWLAKPFRLADLLGAIRETLA
jgi:two-component system NtrC family sensor kinase